MYVPDLLVIISVRSILKVVITNSEKNTKATTPFFIVSNAALLRFFVNCTKTGSKKDEFNVTIWHRRDDTAKLIF